jgi:hypothetical protein
MALLPEQTYVVTSTLVKPQWYEPYKHSVELPIPYDKPAFVSKCPLIHIMGTTFSNTHTTHVALEIPAAFKQGFFVS